MKKLLSLLIISLFTVSAFAQLTEGERAFAIKYLQATQQDVIATVSELSDEAWNYIPEDGGWSVANCLEHILVSEEAFFGMGMGTVASTTPDMSIDFSMGDAMMIGTMTNRGTQVTTSEAMEPSGRWATKE
ncbi:MAG: DinB family protein, partial [Balneolales bacterium]|nr:DinB family protein [Balneolales bacterium]